MVRSLEAQVEGKGWIKISPSFLSPWQRSRWGQQDQSFKCSSVLAKPCASALCGSTESRRAAQHGDSDKTVEPIKTHLPWRCVYTPQAVVGFSIFTSSILTSFYSIVPWGMHFKTMSAMHTFSGFWATLKRTEHHNILGDHCNICLIRIWSATHVHPLTLDIFCGMTKSRGEGERGKEGRVCSPMWFWPILRGLEPRQSIPDPAFDMDGVHYVTESIVTE